MILDYGLWDELKFDDIFIRGNISFPSHENIFLVQIHFMLLGNPTGNHKS